ncbi:MAG: ABC transporter ATP-binding protein [Candidatus Acetothermia bacterium]
MVSENSEEQKAEEVGNAREGTPLLEVDGVTAGYGDINVLFDASIQVNEGEFVVLIGPNGAGKTTLIRSIDGVLEPKEGRVVFGGEDVTYESPADMLERGISTVPQEGNIFTDLSVKDNLIMGAYTYDGIVESRLEMVYDLFPILEERSDQVAGTMSGGQRQMLAISRGTMVDPDMLILDEPTAGLQPNLVTDVLDSIARLKKEENLTVLLVAQTEQAIPMADWGYLLRSGEILVDDRADRLLDNELVSDLYFGG